MSKRNRGNNKKGVSIDLSGVEVGSRKALPEGKYPVTVDSVEIKESSNSGANYMAFTFEVEDGDHKGAKLFHNCSLQPQALFNLKAILLALGFEIPNKAFDLDTSALVGLSCVVEVAHEVYEGKKKARIVDFINPEDDEDGDSDVDLEELDKDELKQLAEALKIPAKKIKKAKTEEDLIELLEDCDDEDLAEKYEELFGDEDDSDSEDDEDSDDDSDTSMEDLDMDQLKELAKALKINSKKVKKCKDKEALIELIEDEAEEDDIEEAIDDLFGDDSDDDEDDEDDEDSDYDSMSLKELKALAKERDIKVKKGMDKDDIIELLEDDDE